MQLFILCIALILFVGYAALIIYYWVGFRQIPEYQPAPNQATAITISVLIPARNEASNIGACLDSICKQTYPAANYEVLVIDDHSTDDTAALVRKYADRGVRLISLANYTNGLAINSYKKKAIEVAVGQARGQLMVCTDADCIVPQRWLETIAAFQLQHDAAFIAMPVRFTHTQRPIEIFQALDFMTLQGITGASVYKRLHSMCNGANLAYTKKAFNAVNGFEGVDAIASGDDMLLMHKIYIQQPDKLFFLKSTDVIVQTQPVQSLAAFFSQRIRWASKADKYDDKRIFAVLLLVYLFNALLAFWPLTFIIQSFPVSLAGISLQPLWWWALLLTAKTMVELIFLYPVAGFFAQRRLLFYFPLAQPFHIAYTLIAGWLGKFGNYRWKERSVR